MYQLILSTDCVKYLIVVWKKSQSTKNNVLLFYQFLIVLFSHTILFVCFLRSQNDRKNKTDIFLPKILSKTPLFQFFTIEFVYSFVLYVHKNPIIIFTHLYSVYYLSVCRYLCFICTTYQANFRKQNGLI